MSTGLAEGMNPVTGKKEQKSGLERPVCDAAEVSFAEQYSAKRRLRRGEGEEKKNRRTKEHKKSKQSVQWKRVPWVLFPLNGGNEWGGEGAERSSGN